jgi:hypothetical protein
LELFLEEIKIKKYPIDVERLEVRFEDFQAEFEYFEIKRSEWQEELAVVSINILPVLFYPL